MLASEARKITEESLSVSSFRIFNQIMQEIKVQAGKGIFYLELDGQIPEQVKEALKRDGYTVNDGYKGVREEYFYTTISW